MAANAAPIVTGLVLIAALLIAATMALRKGASSSSARTWEGRPSATSFSSSAAEEPAPPAASSNPPLFDYDQRFINLQRVNNLGSHDELRRLMTPELYERLKEYAGKSRTIVVKVKSRELSRNDSQLAIHYTGITQEGQGGPEELDEVWFYELHAGAWILAGIAPTNPIE